MYYGDKIFMLNILKSRSKYCRPRSNCTYRNNLKRVYTVCHSISTFRHIKGYSPTDLKNFM